MVNFLVREESIQRKRQSFLLVQREALDSRTRARRLDSGGEIDDPGAVTSLSRLRRNAMGLLRLAVFGPPEVFHDEHRLSFALRKAEALLLYLAVEGGMHSRSRLAALLWPDSE